MLRDGRVTIAADDLPLVLEVRGEPLRLRIHAHLMQHKPLGVVTSRNDDRHPTAWALHEGAPLHAPLRAVGRLELDAAGLLLWTTDTPKVHALTHPKRRVPRTYQVALAGSWREPPRDEAGVVALELAAGSRPRISAIASLDQGGRHPALPLPEGTEALAEVVLLDGAHHEVKRIFAALGTRVLCLARVAHAGVELPVDLPAGGWRELAELPGGGES